MFRETLLVCVASAIVLPSGLRAQRTSEHRSPELRAACVANAETAERRNAPLVDKHLAMLARCDASGPGVFARLWLTQNLSRASLDALVEATSSLRDDRLLTTVVNAAMDRTRPTVDRLSALRVLAIYVRPSAVVPLAYLEKPHANPLGVTDHRPTHVGSQPFSQNSKSRIKSVLEDLSQSASEPVVGPAAAYLLNQLFPRSDGV